jgi:hypothetical protein
MNGFAAIADATGTATGHFALAGDLDATAWSAAHTGTPSVVASLSGTLAGLGHKVDKLTLNAPTESYLGLIGQMTADEGTANVLRDIGVTDVNIIGAGGIGALAGSALDTAISQAYSTGKIQARNGGSVGGLIGYGSSRIDSSFSGVDISATWDSLGGLVGVAASGGIIITDSHATGNITGPSKAGEYYVVRVTGEHFPIYDESGRKQEPPLDDYNIEVVSASNVGGLLGRASYANVDMSYATGNMTSVYGNSVGGLVGTIMGSWEPRPSFQNAVTNSFATGNVIGGFDVGGLIGTLGELLLSNSSPVIVDNTYATGNVTATLGDWRGNSGSIGGLIGFSSYSTVSNSYATGNINTIADSITNNMGGLVGNQRGGSVSNSYATGTVVGNGGNHTGGLVGGGSGSISDSYYQDANAVAAAETAPVRSEFGRIVDDIRLNESEAARTEIRRSGATAARGGSRSGSSLDQYIYDESGYSARVKTISVEGAECPDDDDECS